VVGKIYWFSAAAGTVTFTLNGVNNQVTIPAGGTGTCPVSNRAYRVISFVVTFEAAAIGEVNNLQAAGSDNFAI
jgi:hypothetical protein